MKISNFCVISFASLILLALTPCNLSAQKIGAVTVQETKRAVDAVLYETTPKLNEHFSCDDDCTDRDYCRRHKRFRSRHRHRCTSDYCSNCNSGYTKNNRRRSSSCGSRSTVIRRRSSCGTVKRGYTTCGRSSSSRCGWQD